MSERYERIGLLLAARLEDLHTCTECGALVVRMGTHDKFHDAYKPSRRASFVSTDVDGVTTIQFLDGSVLTFTLDEEMSHEKAIYFLNESNKALAPFYEGGETAISEDDDD